MPLNSTTSLPVFPAHRNTRRAQESERREYANPDSCYSAAAREAGGQKAPITAHEWLASNRLTAIANYVGRRCGVSADDLPDLTQEIRLALWRSGDDRKVNARWVFQIASHKATDLKRQALSIPTESLPDVSDVAAGKEDAELIYLLHAYVARLPAALRQFYKLRFQEILSEREIARLLGLCRSAVRHMEARCRKSITEDPMRWAQRRPSKRLSG
jgi:RNA polymerase sigma factor (sigma-70 family)